MKTQRWCVFVLAEGAENAEEGGVFFVLAEGAENAEVGGVFFVLAEGAENAEVGGVFLFSQRPLKTQRFNLRVIENGRWFLSHLVKQTSPC